MTTFRRDLSPDLAVLLDDSGSVVFEVTDGMAGHVLRRVTVTNVAAVKAALDDALTFQRVNDEQAGCRCGHPRGAHEIGAGICDDCGCNAYRPPAEVVFNRWTREELAAAWKLVKPHPDWKDPVDATVPNEGLDVIEDAVLFFAGSPVTFQPAGGGKVRVTAAGYYACIGS